jgi:hypothetical protein
MKTKFSELPLHVAAARSLRRASKAAMRRAEETQVPLVIWKNGKVTRVPLAKNRSTKADH